MYYLMALILVCCQDGPTQTLDDDTEIQRIAVVVGVMAQADRIPPDFVERAEEKVRAMPPAALPHLLRLMNNLAPETQERLNQCGQSIVLTAKEQSLEVPESYLRKFAESPRQDSAARKTAIQWLDLLNPGVKQQFLIQHISDDSFRRDAIDACLQRAIQPQKEDREAIVQMLELAFEEVRDLDQAQKLTEALKAREVLVSPEKQLGIVTQWNCETMLKSAVSVESQAQPTVPSGGSFHVRIKQESADLLTHVILKQLPVNCPVVLRSVIQSDGERDVQILITSNRCPRLHVNREEILLAKNDPSDLRCEELNEYTKSLHLLRGANDFALKFEGIEQPDSPAENETSSEILYCVRIVDDEGKGLHAPRLISKP